MKYHDDQKHSRNQQIKRHNPHIDQSQHCILRALLYKAMEILPKNVGQNLQPQGENLSPVSLGNAYVLLPQ